MIVEDQSEVLEALSRPETYGSADPVERIDTHISAVFLTGDRAFKLKRAVRLPYLDYSTPEARRRFCHAEVRINRRTAPALYHGVVAVVRDPDGRLRLGGEGKAVDWLVEMTRFEEHMLFDRLAVEGRLDRFAMEDLADAVARFHGAAERVADAGGRAAVLKVIESNADCFAEAPAGILDAAAVGTLREASWRLLAGVEGLLEERRAAGFVRHCHGDLHLRNICLFEGQATLFDAIEFSQEIANIDVLYDLAFLVMDLDHRGLRRLASILLNRYLDITADIGGLAAMPLFLSLRAGIRSHVAALSSTTQSDASAAEALRTEARTYLGEALAYLEPAGPRLIAVGGLSGSGKSRLARDLAPLVGPSPGARVVRTDVTRKRLAGVGLETRLGSAGYSRDMTERTYQAVYDECLAVLATGRAAIADAVFAHAEERTAIEAVAREAGVPFHGLWLESPPEVMQERVTHRKRNVSDATSWVVRLQLSYDLGDITWDRIDTGGSREDSVARARTVLGLA